VAATSKTKTRRRVTPVEQVDDPFYDVAGCAAYLGRTERWVRRNVNEGKLPYVRMGGRLAFRQSQLEQWIEENTTDPQGE